MGLALVGCDSKQESTTNPTVDGTGSAQALQTTENDQTLAISEEDAKYLQDVEPVSYTHLTLPTKTIV